VLWLTPSRHCNKCRKMQLTLYLRRPVILTLVDGAATEKVRQASSVCMRGTTSIGASVVHGSVPAHWDTLEWLWSGTSHNTSTPVYSTSVSTSLQTPLLVKPFVNTDFARRSFRFYAFDIWNSACKTVVSSLSLCLSLSLSQSDSLQALLQMFPCNVAFG